MVRNIVLVGFSGAGKTTLGRALALRLGLEFVDLDDAIEEKYHATIPHIFQKYGESVFRQCEYQTLKEMLKCQGMVIAAGGGTPANQDAMRLMNEFAATVYVDLSEETLVQRLKNSKKERPLTAGLTEDQLVAYVQERLEQRLPYYRMAQLTVKGDEVSAENLCERICHLFAK
ncbi:MAG: shikimate kinase [Bacteroidales bacterium]|nr:shikimate kinase [Bacteroidales bacterium]